MDHVMLQQWCIHSMRDVDSVFIKSRWVSVDNVPENCITVLWGFKVLYWQIFFNIMRVYMFADLVWFLGNISWNFVFFSLKFYFVELITNAIQTHSTLVLSNFGVDVFGRTLVFLYSFSTNIYNICNIWINLSKTKSIKNNNSRACR